MNPLLSNLVAFLPVTGEKKGHRPWHGVCTGINLIQLLLRPKLQIYKSNNFKRTKYTMLRQRLYPSRERKQPEQGMLICVIALANWSPVAGENLREIWLHLMPNIPNCYFQLLTHLKALIWNSLWRRHGSIKISPFWAFSVLWISKTYHFIFCARKQIHFL